MEEKGHRVLFAPFSEAMWLFWRDYSDQNGKLDKHVRALDRFAEQMKQISASLGAESPFENNPESLRAIADTSVGYYAGAFGRFRGAKIQGDLQGVDGIITAASTYENTAISLNILQKSFADRQSRPILNLTFDGNKNENDIMKCESFLYYL